MELKPHPSSPGSPIETILVEAAFVPSTIEMYRDEWGKVAVRTKGRDLAVTFDIKGDLSKIVLPEVRPAIREDGLWRSTCLEAFVLAEDRQAYYELNFAPSEAWAFYRFESERRGGMNVEGFEPNVGFSVQPFGARVNALAPIPADAIGPIGLSAVIETTDGAISYWALAHPSDKPDFHHPDSFVLELP